MSDLPSDPAALAAAVRAGDRLALARAITLVESSRPADETAAEALLRELLPHTGTALRVGITGAPGVGKSTWIDALGSQLCDDGHRVAVLAVDPSSARTGGSILGDKTRMAKLAARRDALIRPSPGGRTLGGTAARTREALLVCEAAGFDVVLVETIGTGQSETAVSDLVDYFLLLLSPAAGDELQGIKRGVMELCDGVFVNKADGDLRAAADRTAQHCRLALQVLRHDEPEETLVTAGSAQTGHGLAELWQAVEASVAARRSSGAFAQRRRAQASTWLDTILREHLLASFFDDPVVADALPRLRAAVASGAELPGAAARQLLRLQAGS